MTARWLWFTPPVAWLRKKEMGGGQVFDQLIHIVDLFLYLAGRVRSVSALYHHEKKDPDFDNWDVNSLLLSFESGCIANLSCTYKLDIPLEERVWIEIVADNLLCRFGTKRLSFFDSQGQKTLLETGDVKEPPAKRFICRMHNVLCMYNCSCYPNFRRHRTRLAG